MSRLRGNAGLCGALTRGYPDVAVVETTNTPPGRAAFVSLYIAVAVAMVGLGIIAPILPLYAERFAANRFSLGIVFAAFSISRSILGPFVGRLSDWIGRRRILLLGLGGFAVLSALYIATDSLWQMGVVRFLQGAASVMVTPIAQAYVGDHTPKGKEGWMMNLFYSAMFVGMAVGPLLGGWIGEVWSYSTAFAAMGILSVVALILVAATVPTDRRARSARPEEKPAIVPLRQVLSHDAVKAIGAYFVTRGFWRQGFTAFYPLFAVSLAGFGEASVGLVLFAYMLAGGILQIPFGWLADRLPRVPMILAGSLGAPALLFAVPFARSLTGILLLSFGMGAMSALSRASVLAIRTELGRTHGMGTVAGLQSSAIAVGRMIGPLASGLVADLAGVAAVFPLGGGIGLLGTGLVWLWLRRWRGEAR